MEHREAPGNDDDIALRKQQVVILLFLCWGGPRLLAFWLACQSSNCTSCREIVETWPAATMPRPEVSRSLRVNYPPVFPDLSP